MPVRARDREQIIREVVAALRAEPTPCDINLYGPAADFIEGRFLGLSRCDHPLGSSEGLSVRCARPSGHGGPHRSVFEDTRHA